MIHKIGVKGFTIVELLVSLVIAGIILSGVVQVAVNGKRSAQDGQEISFIQDNARFVVDQLKRDVFAAGYRGCVGRGNAGSVNAVKDNLNGFIDIEQGVRGYDGDAGTDSFPNFYKDDVKLTSDSIVVRYADPGAEYKVKSHDPATATFTLWSTQAINKGTTMLVTDASCRASGLFQVTSEGASSSTLKHEGDDKRNCINTLRVEGLGDLTCGDCSVAGACVGISFSNGASLMPYRAYAYYVGDSEIVKGMPALKRVALTTNSSGIADRETEELAHGVDDLQITYGLDLDGDNIANRFVEANNVNANEWATVVSMRVRLVFRSASPVYATDQKLELNIDGKNVVISEDKYLRQVVTTNIKLRNS